jgi:hypothetical protein
MRSLALDTDRASRQSSNSPYYIWVFFGVIPSKLAACSNHRVYVRLIDLVDGPAFSRLPDFRKVAAGQDCKEARCHTRSRSRWA